MATKKNKRAGDPGDEPLLSDQEWADLERSFTKESTKSAAYKEPSARQRELTEKWKKDEPKDTGWRTDGPPADLSPKPGGGGPKSAPRPVRHRRPWLRNLVWALVAALVTVAIIGGPKLFSSSKGSEGASPAVPVGTASGAGTAASAASSLSSASTASTASAASARARAVTSDEQYFDGSPSQQWADGAAGIVPPAAVAVGGYSAQTVGAATPPSRRSWSPRTSIPRS
ncbi:hypothetical protein ACFQ9X_08250 [Catenulispora yoronensis]